jgi:hypothetical protein
LAEIVIGDEVFCSAAQNLLFLPIDELPRLAEFRRTPCLYFHKCKRPPFEGDNVQFSGSAMVAPGENVKTLFLEKKASDPFTLSSLEQMRRGHIPIVSAGRRSFHTKRNKFRRFHRYVYLRHLRPGFLIEFCRMG